MPGRAVEAFNVGVLRRFSWLNVDERVFRLFAQSTTYGPYQRFAVERRRFAAPSAVGDYLLPSSEA